MSADVALDAAEAEFRRRRIARFPPLPLVWLAALPEWTDRLAAAAGFPVDDLPAFLARLDAAGLLGRRADVDPDGELVTAFWLPASRRADVGTHLRTVLPPDAPADALRQLAGGLRAAGEHRAWLGVVEHHLADPSGVGLLTTVERLVDDGAAEDALSVVGAAQALGDLLGEPLASSARRAQWRIDRGHRQALDARAVAHYLPHPEVEEALRDLLAGPGGSWALHLLGDGGVGKTMAVRDLASGRFAERSGLAHPSVARVDFDHLDPRYPYGRPGELLLALVGELFSHARTRDAELAFRASDDALAHLHEAMSDLAPSGELDPRLLDDAIATFATYLEDLGGAVLVLDTCEELAKLHPPGGRAPAVDSTFELVERLHGAAPSVRVVLAGRRPLVPSAEGRRSGGLLLQPRPYLRVVEVGGFTADQARTYLDRRDPAGAVGPALRDAVLARCSRAAGSGINPYDLACYADWASSEPDLDPRELLDAPGDPYVEQRILARLPSSEVRDCLAVAVELGRFDRPMIEPALARRGIDADAAFSGLVGQEWVSAVTFDATGRPRVIEVDEQLRPRLRAVLAAAPERFPDDRAGLRRDLRALCDTLPIGELAVEAVEAAVRLLPVGEASGSVARLAARVASEEGGWDWALQAAARAAAVEAPRAAAGGATVQAALLALQTAAQRRLPGAPALGPLWQQVLDLAPRDPVPAHARELEFRALCGLLASGAGDDRVRERVLDRVAADWPALPVDPLLAALDALDAADGRLSRALADLRSDDDPAVAVTAALAQAAALVGAGDASRAADAVRSALDRADRPGPSPPRDRPDWSPPARVRDRARLAGVVLAAAGSGPPDALPLEQWRAEVLADVTDIDAERLAAATIVHELAWRPVDLDSGVRAAVAMDDYVPGRVPTCSWHRWVPPLAVATARALAAAGDAPAAAAVLRRRRDDAVAAGEDATTITLCEVELAGLSRAFRSLRFTASTRRTGRDRSDAATVALALVEGRVPKSPEEAGSPRTWWRTRFVVGEAHAVPHPVPGGTRLADLLDGVEAELLASGRPGPVGATALSAWSARMAGPLRPLLDDADDLGAVLRAGPLLGDGVADVALPPRLLGELALAEGELLALRLPVAGAALLARARDAFRLAGDRTAAARAAALHVLAVHRAGLAPDRAARLAEEDRSALAVVLAEEPDWSGWPARLARARALLDGSGAAPGPDDPSPELAGGPRAVRTATVAGATGTAVGSTGMVRSSVVPIGPWSTASVPSPHWPSMSARAAPSPPDLRVTASGVPAADTPGGGPVQPALRRRGAWSAFGAVFSVLACLGALGVAIALAGQGVGATATPPSVPAVPSPAAGPSPLTEEPPPPPEEPPSGSGVPGSPTASSGTTAQPTVTTSVMKPVPSGTPLATPRDRADPPATVLLVLGLLLAAGVAGLVVSRLLARRRGPAPQPPAPGAGDVAAQPPAAAAGGRGRPVVVDGPSVVLPPASAPVAEGARAYRVDVVTGDEPSAPDLLAVRVPEPAAAGEALRWRTRTAWGGGPAWPDYRGPAHLRPVPGPRRGGPRVLHLVGTPVATRAGWRLRVRDAAEPWPQVGGERGYTYTSSPPSQQSVAQQQYVEHGWAQRARGVFGGEQILGPDDLERPATMLVVLQAEPADRARGLGRQQPGMHALAAELRETWGHAVLVVPPLPDARARALVQYVAATVGTSTGPPHAVAVLDLAHEVRRGLVASSAGPAAVQDVALFVDAVRMEES